MIFAPQPAHTTASRSDSAVRVALCVLLASALVACADERHTVPPRGAHGVVVDRQHIVRYETVKMPRTTGICPPAREGKHRTCQNVTIGTEKVRRRAGTCYRVSLNTGKRHCVSKELYANTRIGDRW